MQAEQKLTSPAAATLSDYDAIRETIQHYIAGGKTGNSDVPRKFAVLREHTTNYGY